MSDFNWKIIFELSKDSLAESLFPGKVSCRACGSFFPRSRLLAGLCPSCVERWRELWRLGAPCPRCGSFFWPGRCLGPCSQGFAGFSEVAAAAPYRGIYRNMVMALKYEGRQELAETMGFLMAMAWRERERRPGGSGPLAKRGPPERVPWLVPIPLHREKAEKRGFNQSLLLARSVGKNLGFPVKEILYRQRPGKVQAGLDQRQRKTALDGLFQAAPGYLPDPAQPLVLVDDVITTGATLMACRQALGAEKALRIKALAFAAGAGPQADQHC